MANISSSVVTPPESGQASQTPPSPQKLSSSPQIAPCLDPPRQARSSGSHPQVAMNPPAWSAKSQVAASGLFELRRMELARRIGAEAALVRIRLGAASITAHAASATAEAQAVIPAERASTTTAIALAKSSIAFL